MLKTIGSPDISKLKGKNGNGKVVEFDIGDDSKKLAKKLGNLSKSQKLSKSGKK